MFREMRCREKELPREMAEKMLCTASYGTLALHGDNGYPYSIPVNYAYQDGKVYFHGATVGHKFDAITANDRASLYRFQINFSDIRVYRLQSLTRVFAKLPAKITLTLLPASNPNRK